MPVFRGTVHPEYRGVSFGLPNRLKEEIYEDELRAPCRAYLQRLGPFHLFLPRHYGLPIPKRTNRLV